MRFALFAKGFRPFFLLAALWAVASVPLWLLVQSGYVRLGAYFIATDWHAHEMVFGFAAAVIAGFLLTAAVVVLTLLAAGLVVLSFFLT